MRTRNNKVQSTVNNLLALLEIAFVVGIQMSKLYHWNNSFPISLKITCINILAKSFQLVCRVCTLSLLLHKSTLSSLVIECEVHEILIVLSFSQYF